MRHLAATMNRATPILLLLAILLLSRPGSAVAANADTFSPVVSYQYQDSLDDSPATSPIISPVVSYQYFDWVGDANVTFTYTPNVSYYFSGVPSITIGPLKQFVQAGANITLNVQAQGPGAFSYQWFRNGLAIPGATASSLALSNVQPTQAGFYSVIVTNSYGQVTSAAAYLTVAKDLGTVAPRTPTYAAITPETGKDSLVLITHGRTPTTTNSDWQWQLEWMNAMKVGIKANVASASNWFVVDYQWRWDSAPIINGEDLLTVTGYAEGHGRTVAKQLIEIAKLTPNGRLEHIHLIGHSAGCALINEAARVFKAASPQTVIHTTFLDPFLGVKQGGRASYGEYSDWSDNYFSYSPDSGDGVLPWTYGPMANAHNVDVTWLDPQKTILPIYSLQSPVPTYAAKSTHGWPITFYQNTIPPIPPNRPQDYGNYGFPLSKESGNWGNHSLYPINNNPAVILGGQNVIAQQNSPVSSNLALNFSAIPHVVGQSGSVQFSASSFTATTGGAQTAALQAGRAMQFNAATQGAPSYSPVWTSVPVDVSSRVNFVKFDATFSSQPGATGLLTVFWNDVQIGQIDESYVTPGITNYTFMISSAYLDKSNSLGFRLDQGSNVLSTVNVSNVSTGLSGLTTPHQLTIANAAGAGTPILTLTGALGYTYIVETSTDLINWVQMAAVTLDTATTFPLSAPSVPSEPKRFYRAVSP